MPYYQRGGSWAVEREATAEDVARLEAASARFAARHGIAVAEGETAVQAVQDAVCYVYGAAEVEQLKSWRLNRLYARVVRRALRSGTAEGIAYGTVGHTVGATRVQF